MDRKEKMDLIWEKLEPYKAKRNYAIQLCVVDGIEKLSSVDKLEKNLSTRLSFNIKPGNLGYDYRVLMINYLSFWTNSFNIQLSNSFSRSVFDCLANYCEAKAIK
jgi:hypothetical protein